MALIKEKGQITSIGEVISNEGRNGNVYSNLTLVVKIYGYQNSYRELALNVGGDRINDVLEFQEGQMVEIGYNVSSRYWAKGDRWFTTAELYTISAPNASEQRDQRQQRAAAPRNNAPAAPAQSQPMNVAAEDEGKDDLPF